MKQIFYLGAFFALFLLLADGSAQDAPADSVGKERPKFSMTPT